MINVVAAYIHEDGKTLIARRSTGAADVIGKWEFPGGKVKDGETEKEAIKREIKEEFGIEIKANELIIRETFKCPTKTIRLSLYDCRYISGDYFPHDHSEYAFVQNDELLNYDLCPADIPLAKYIVDNLGDMR
jgi:8-oxo-dGTP diphosphatase